MKILFDENVPQKLKKDLAEFSIYTIQDMGWRGKQNGELLKLMLVNNFKALVTGDKDMQHQQNFKTYPVPVILLNLRHFTYKNIKPYLPALKRILATDLQPGITKLPSQIV